MPRTDPAKRRLLAAEIERQGGVHEFDDRLTPVVSLDLFFDGNHDPGSIAPNLFFHPGIKVFRKTLFDLRARDDVQDILVAISEVPDVEEEWPYTSTIYILSRASRRDIVKALRRLKPDEVGPVLPGTDVPRHLPQPEPGYEIYLAWWD